MIERSAMAVLICLVLLYALSVVAFKILWPWRGAAKGLLAQCCHGLRCRATGADEAEFERKVADECSKRRGERACTFLILSSLLTVYHCSLALWAIYVGGGAKKAEFPFHLAFMVATTTLTFFPRLLTPRVIDLVYLGSVASMVSRTVSVGPAGLVGRDCSFLCFLFWSLFDLKPWLNACGVLCVLSAELVVFARFGVPFELLAPGLATHLAVVITLIGIDCSFQQGLRFEILAADSKSELTAVQILLKSICDVVVQLDGQLRLIQHAPKLADVLLLPAARNLAGADLRDYMAADTDRAAFSEHLRIPDGNCAQAAVFHARLRDSTSSSVAMEFFTVDFRSRDGAQHHIVGMREHTDIQPLARQEDAPPPPPVAVRMPRKSQAGGRPRTDRPGTPSSTQQWDLNDHHSDSRSACGLTEPADENGESVCSTGLDPPVASHGARELAPAHTAKDPVVVETSEAAKVATTNYLLMSWVLEAARHSCCPKHAAIVSLRGVLDTLSQRNCARSWPSTDWQCSRCGIRGEEHRDPDRKERKACLVCEDLDDSFFRCGSSTAAKIGASL